MYNNNVNCHLMKPLERQFFRYCIRQIRYEKVEIFNRYPSVSTSKTYKEIIDEFYKKKKGSVNKKLFKHYLDKWNKLGFYECGSYMAYGSACMVFDLVKMPTAYADIVPERVSYKLSRLTNGIRDNYYYEWNC